MMVKLEAISEIVQGAIYTRIKSDNNIDECTLLDTISMQELNYTIGNSLTYEKQESKVLNSKISSCIFTKKDDVLVGLTMQKAMVITSERSGKLTLSNFAVIRIHDKNIVDPNYLCWLLNENSYFKKVIEQSSQGTAYVSTLSIATLRGLEIPLVDIEKQRKIGQLYQISIQRKKVGARLEELKDNLLKSQIEIIYKGEIVK